MSTEANRRKQTRMHRHLASHTKTMIQTLAVWNWKSQTLLRHIQCQERCINYCARFSGDTLDSLLLATGTVFNSVLVWNLQRDPNVNHSQTVLPPRLARQCPNPQAVELVFAPARVECKGHTGVLFSVSFDATRQRLCSVSDDRTVRLWSIAAALKEASTTKQVIESTSTFFGHRARVWSAKFTSFGIVSASEDSTCRVWSFTGTPLLELEGRDGKNIWSLAVHEAQTLDDCVAVTGTENGTIRSWSLNRLYSQAASSHQLPTADGTPGSVVAHRMSKREKRSTTVYSDAGASWIAPCPYPGQQPIPSNAPPQPSNTSTKRKRPRTPETPRHCVFVTANLALILSARGDLFAFFLESRTYQLLLAAEPHGVSFSAAFVSACIVHTPRREGDRDELCMFVCGAADGVLSVGMIAFSASPSSCNLLATVRYEQERFTPIHAFLPDNQRCAPVVFDSSSGVLPLFVVNARNFAHLVWWDVRVTLGDTTLLELVRRGELCMGEGALAGKPSTVCSLPHSSIVAVGAANGSLHFFDLTRASGAVTETHQHFPSKRNVLLQQPCLHELTATEPAGTPSLYLPLATIFSLHGRDKRLSHLVVAESRPDAALTRFCTFGADGFLNELELSTQQLSSSSSSGPSELVSQLKLHQHVVDVALHAADLPWTIRHCSSRLVSRNPGERFVPAMQGEAGSALSRALPAAGLVAAFAVNQFVLSDIASGETLARIPLLTSTCWDVLADRQFGWLLMFIDDELECRIVHARPGVASSSASSSSSASGLAGTAGMPAADTKSAGLLLRGFHHREIRSVVVLPAPPLAPAWNSDVVLFAACGEDTTITIGASIVPRHSAAAAAEMLRPLRLLLRVTDHAGAVRTLASLPDPWQPPGILQQPTVGPVYSLLLSAGGDCALVAWRVCIHPARLPDLLAEESTALQSLSPPVAFSKLAVCQPSLLTSLSQFDANEDDVSSTSVRLLSIDAITLSGQHQDTFVLVACSDGWVRLLGLIGEAAGSQGAAFVHLSSSNLHQRCPLVVKLAALHNLEQHGTQILLAASAATDGRVILWHCVPNVSRANAAGLSAVMTPIAQVRAHQSGVNSLSLVELPTGVEGTTRLCVATGGDDNSIVLSTVDLALSATGDQLSVTQVRAGSTSQGHSSSVTSVHLTRSSAGALVLRSASIDQRINTWMIGDLSRLERISTPPLTTPLSDLRQVPLPPPAVPAVFIHHSSAIAHIPDVGAMDVVELPVQRRSLALISGIGIHAIRQDGM
ncbi:hypothetical protein CAOG_007403 [Capsaspora owczarzaki ATCC 30864]|uniref:Uncharacterized protein n=1 Tax=Capsaspora owczarzaki (strain ATCC 30864) TaxID=595528 RepID=A0A0D2URF2_CAPO3|nr:hypothetical protein CAOG_007403 [Capsaspora owczarzaki ATCC 30864]